MSDSFVGDMGSDWIYTRGILQWQERTAAEICVLSVLSAAPFDFVPDLRVYGTGEYSGSLGLIAR